jgi:hypothetical protein
LRSFRSCLSICSFQLVQLQRDLVEGVEGEVVDDGEFQLKEISMYRKIEDKSVEAENQASTTEAGRLKGRPAAGGRRDCLERSRHDNR